MQENVIKERSETKLAADKLSGNSYLSSPELKMEDTVSTVSVRSSFDRCKRKLSVFTTVECYYRVLDGSNGPGESE